MSATSERLSFGDLLRRHRAAAGLTQEELADQAGLSARAITDLERSVRGFPYPETVARLATALHLDDRAAADFHKAARRGPTNSRPADTDKHRHTVATPLTRLIGRSEEISTTRQALHMARLITLVGTDGVGKTRVALEVAQQLRDDYADGAYVVDLAPVREPELAIATIARVLDIRQGSAQHLFEALQDVLRHKSVLLVLDNLEQVRAVGPAEPRFDMLQTIRELRAAIGIPRLPVERLLLERTMRALSIPAHGEHRPNPPLSLSAAVDLAIAATQ